MGRACKGYFSSPCNRDNAQQRRCHFISTASRSASEIVSSLYGPIFSRIDPEEVGSRSRAMRIGEDYGIRLNQRFKNLKADQLGTLSRSYSSHGFVIDMKEAKALFHRVREATPEEKSLVQRVGVDCRYPAREPTIKNLADYFTDHSIEKSNPEPKDDEPPRKSRLYPTGLRASGRCRT